MEKQVKIHKRLGDGEWIVNEGETDKVEKGGDGEREE